MEILLGCAAIAITLAVPVLALIILVRLSAQSRRIEWLEREVALLREADGSSEDHSQPVAEEPVPVEEPPVPEPPPLEEPPPPETLPIPPEEPPAPPPPDLHEAAFGDGGHASAGPSLSARLRNFDWESLVGVKLFSWIAGVALALAAVFLLKYSFDRGLLDPPVRMAIGLTAGLGLLVLSELKIAERYRVTANAMDAAGIAILYATLFSAHAIWRIVPGAVAFTLLILVTAIAVWLSIRRDSAFIALLGLIGGFATPALLSSGEDQPITLFSYLLLLNAGLAWVAYRKNWPALAALALIFTTVYQWGWVVEFLGSSNLPLAVAVFLAFPLLTVGAFLFGTRGSLDRVDGVFGRSAVAASVVPMTFAAYMAAVPAYGERHHLLFALLLLVDVGLAAIAISRRGAGGLHVLGAISTVLVVMIWTGVSYTSPVWPSVLGWVAALVTFYLLAPRIEYWWMTRRGDGNGERVTGRAVWAGPLLLAIFPVLAAIEPETRAPWLLFGTLFALVAVTGLVAARRASPGLHHLGAILAIVTLWVWSRRHLDAGLLVPAVVLYAGFAVLLLAMAVWSRRDHLSAALDPSLPLVGMFPLLILLAGGSSAALSLPALAILIGTILGGLYWQRSGMRWVVTAVLLSWIVLQVWWSTVEVRMSLWPAMMVVAALSIAVLAGSSRLRRGRTSPDAWFALFGHLFLLAVASRPELTASPWPLLASLAVLTLGTAVASRFVDPRIHPAGILATQVVLLTWAGSATDSSVTCIVATLVVAAFAVAWRSPLATRESGQEGTAGFAALVALLLGELVVVVATRDGTPFILVLLAHVAILVTILRMAAERRWNLAAVLAAVPASIAIFSFGAGGPEGPIHDLILGGVIYVIFLVYPLVVARRAPTAREPYVAALLMSVSIFFFGRTSMLERGFDGVIGALPLAQALFLGALVYRLVTLEPPGRRDVGRLALVAGVALGFLTVAVPLQFDREWVTLGWALEGTALVWLFRRVPHRGLLVWAAALLGIAFLRLAFNPAVLAYHPRSDTPVLNWYLYAYTVVAAASFIAARLLTETERWAPRLGALWNASGTILLFLLLNIEIADYFSTGPVITFDFSAGLAQDLTYTLGWALFAIGLLVAGLVTGHRAARVAAIGLLLVSALKGFLRDLMKLGGLYRIGSLVGLAVALALVAILLQKFVLSRRATAGDPAASSSLEPTG